MRYALLAWIDEDEHPDTWAPGIFSVVRFTLPPAPEGTRLVIDHAGIPPEWEEHIEGGYPTFYADPLARYFSA